MNVSIEITVTPGSHVASAAADAQRVADLLGIRCTFMMNGVRCTAVPHGSAALLATRQQEAQSRGAGMFASSRVRVEADRG